MTDLPVVPARPLEQCCPLLAAELHAALLQQGHGALAELVPRISLPAQAIDDRAEDFGFMVRLEPALAPQSPLDRCDWASLVLSLSRGELHLWLDDFGRPSEVRVLGRADLHCALKALKGHIGPR